MSTSSSALIPSTLRPSKEVILFQQKVQALGYDSDQIDRITDILLSKLLPVLLANDSKEWVNRIQKGQINFDHHSAQRALILANLPKTANANPLADLIEEFSFDHLSLNLVPILGKESGPILKQAILILKMGGPHKIDQQKIDQLLRDIEFSDYAPQQKKDIKTTLTLDLMRELLEPLAIASSTLTLVTNEKTRSKPIEAQLNKQLLDRLNAIFKRSVPSIVQSSPDGGAFVAQTILNMVQQYISHE